WYFSGNPIPGATQDTLSVSTPGSYSVRVFRGGATQESESILVTQIPPPDVSIILETAPFFCPGHSIFLKAVSGDELSYQWKMNGTDIPGAVDSILEVSQTGNYAVTVTNVGCSRTSHDTLVQEEPLPMPKVVPSVSKTI